MEVKQMLGRAGRPGYDDQGQAWILSRGADRLETADNIAERYIHGDVENVVSKLSAEFRWTPAENAFFCAWVRKTKSRFYM